MGQTSFTAEFAGISVAISSPSPEIRDFCADYIVDRPGDLPVCVNAGDIAAEEARAARDSGENDGGESVRNSAPAVIYELSALHRKIAEAMPLYGRFVMHGAAITYGGGAYLFCAPSGVGKSTHIALWRRYLGDRVGIINGDKPFLSLEGRQSQHLNGTEVRAEGECAVACGNANEGECIRVHGSPWAGKELWQRNSSAELRAICLITRGKENSIRRLGAGESVGALMRQIYLPRSAEAAQATLGLADALVRLVPVFELGCDVSEEAVRCSFEALTGLAYPAEKQKTNG